MLFMAQMQVVILFNSMNIGKIANLESMVSGHCTTLCEHVISMRASYFDINFASQMKLTKFPLIHCFETADFKSMLWQFF